MTHNISTSVSPGVKGAGFRLFFIRSNTSPLSSVVYVPGEK